MTRPVVLFAGGGTGGHVFPALAVADALVAQADVEIVFAGTARGVEARVVPAAGFRLELLDVEPMKGGGIVRAARGAIVAALAMRRAHAMVRSLAPRVVLSVGGYAAGPAALAAALARIPMTVLEPNRTPGLANRILAPFAKRAYLGWEASGSAFRPATRRLLGIPLRSAFRPSAYRPRSGVCRLLVLGGSQGASALNERLPQAILRLGARPGLEVLHQTGRGKDAPVREVYARSDATANVRVVEFLDDMATALAEADLVIARSGAATVAEVACVGRATIFVPFPDAADDHQTANAGELVQVGGAVSLVQSDATPERLAAEISLLLDDDVHRVAMADAARRQGRPTAAADVASDLRALAGIQGRAPSGRSAHVHPAGGSPGAP